MMWCIWKTFIYLPLGWASWMCGHVFLGGGPGDIQRLAAVTDAYRKNGYGPFCLYPEGAVLVPHLHEKSNAYAEKCVLVNNQTPSGAVMPACRLDGNEWTLLLG
jgi:hypothetical protein